nr:hypothetical protein [Mesorhizobium delmotii]
MLTRALALDHAKEDISINAPWTRPCLCRPIASRLASTRFSKEMLIQYPRAAWLSRKKSQV